MLVSCRKPADMDSVFLDRSFEWRHGASLRHTRDVADVAVGCIGNAIGISACRGVIDHEQVAIASVGCVITIHTLTMTVARVAGDTAVAHPCRSETLAWFLVQREHMFKEVLTLIEVGFHSCCVSYRWCRVGITWFLCRSQLTSGIPFLCREHIVGLAKSGILRFGSRRCGVIIGTCLQQWCRKHAHDDKHVDCQMFHIICRLS